MTGTGSSQAARTADAADREDRTTTTKSVDFGIAVAYAIILLF